VGEQHLFSPILQSPLNPVPVVLGVALHGVELVLDRGHRPCTGGNLEAIKESVDESGVEVESRAGHVQALLEHRARVMLIGRDLTSRWK